MNRDELLHRIAELAEVADMPPPRDRCWVDGRSCPYGWPEGRFDLRPETFCHSGCDCYARYVDVGEVPEETQNEIIREFFVNTSAKLGSFISELGDTYPVDSPEMLILHLAGDLISGDAKKDCEILPDNELPATKKE